MEGQVGFEGVCRQRRVLSLPGHGGPASCLAGTFWLSCFIQRTTPEGQTVGTPALLGSQSSGGEGPRQSPSRAISTVTAGAGETKDLQPLSRNDQFARWRGSYLRSHPWLTHSHRQPASPEASAGQACDRTCRFPRPGRPCALPSANCSRKGAEW